MPKGQDHGHDIHSLYIFLFYFKLQLCPICSSSSPSSPHGDQLLDMGLPVCHHSIPPLPAFSSSSHGPSRTSSEPSPLSPVDCAHLFMLFSRSG